jgi:hypothetical protein
MKKTFLLTAALGLLVNCLFAQEPDAMGQQNGQLSPEQQETVCKFLTQYTPGNQCFVQQSKLPVDQAKAEMVKDIDPILVSNLVASEKAF